VRTTIIAFGGYLYSIAKWLPLHVRHYSAGAFGFTQRWCQDFAATIREPVTLIGFSEGANAAMAVASHSPMVTRAIVHSCEDKPVEFNAGCEYRFFATLKDSTPTFEGTVSTAMRALKSKIRHHIQFLPFAPFASPTWFERRILAPRFHIFHNVLPQLSALGV
jgi:hypothetical protein